MSFAGKGTKLLGNIAFAFSSENEAEMNIRVLLVDPESDLLDNYYDFLIREGFDVQTAANGQDCLQKLREWVPNVLVLEPDMPNGSGGKILDEVSKYATEVIILSRLDRDSVSHSHPVRAYHVKPFSLSELANSIRATASTSG